MTRATAAPLEVAPCHAHGRPSRDWATLVATGEPITWRVTATGGLVDSSHEGRRARPVLACGALLRLDGVESTLLNPCEGPPYVAVVRRFAVLDGPLAGTCWELHTVEDDASPPDRDHQIPVTPSGTRAQRGPG